MPFTAKTEHVNQRRSHCLSIWQEMSVIWSKHALRSCLVLTCEAGLHCFHCIPCRSSLPVCVCVTLPGSCVHVLRLPAGPLGPAGVQPVLSKELLTLPPPAPSPGLEVPQLHFHAHRVSSLLAVEFLIMSSSPCGRFWDRSREFLQVSASEFWVLEMLQWRVSHDLDSPPRYN